MNRKMLTLLALSLAAPLAQATPQGFEWFPRIPGPKDPLYLIAVDPCHSDSLHGVLYDRVEASFLNPDGGDLSFRYESDLMFCNGAPPSIRAIPIPRTIDDAAVERMTSTHVQYEYRFENGNIVQTDVDEVSWTENLPKPMAIPPSIAGTWFSADHAEQGILINMTAKRELLVGWTTYGADGKQRWFSGIAPTVVDESTVTLTLTDTGDGRFAGQLPNDAPQKDWGTLTIEYVACGEIAVQWTPKPDTGLTAGSATMQQLTQPHDAACDIEAYAATLGQALNIHELEIEALPPSDE